MCTCVSTDRETDTLGCPLHDEVQPCSRRCLDAWDLVFRAELS